MKKKILMIQEKIFFGKKKHETFIIIKIKILKIFNNFFILKNCYFLFRSKGNKTNNTSDVKKLIILNKMNDDPTISIAPRWDLKKDGI